MNEETVLAAGSLILFTYMAKVHSQSSSPPLCSHPHRIQAAREPYRDWANGHIQRIKGVLDNARSEHTQAVKDRISSVEDMKDVVALTKGLFALSKVSKSINSRSMPVTHFLPPHLTPRKPPIWKRRRSTISKRPHSPPSSAPSSTAGSALSNKQRRANRPP